MILKGVYNLARVCITWTQSIRKSSLSVRVWAGLTSAILLGEMGIKATIIERRPVPGGLLRSYARQGVDCAVGLHYFGPADKGETPSPDV